jgi:glycosyltransferase involved in cell wall biosynthesis
MKLVWNGIVRNEEKVIRRCVESLMPWIDAAIIVDTGSTDATIAILEEMFVIAGKPIEIHHASFENFEQARNVALMEARNSLNIKWDYLILVDADMELKVTDPDWLKGLDATSYDMRQVGGNLGYLNRRMISRDAVGWYVGVTHEYLDTGPSLPLTGAEFIDHADGANRPNKVQRDIDLLQKALVTETQSGMIERYTFYLANSYFEARHLALAEHHYRKRVAMGGFEEERWNSQYRIALCRKLNDDNDGFVAEMLKAYNMRPTRAESLHQLAQHYRERNEPHASLLFSEAGIKIHGCSDVLFVNEYAYDFGCKEEFAICAYYDPARRQRGAEMCDKISLSKRAGEFSKNQARTNQYWYLKTLVEHVPSFEFTRIPFTPPEGWAAMNPSVINRSVNGVDTPIVLVRTVNYEITPEGVYAIRGTDGSYSRDNPISTRNYLCVLDHGLNLKAVRELALPTNWPEPKFDLVRGFEDSRLFEYGGILHTVSTVRELTEEGWCEQVLAQVSERGYCDNWQVMRPEIRRHEKNWMPWADGWPKTPDDKVSFVYRLNSLIDSDGRQFTDLKSLWSLDHISGGSQVIYIGEGRCLALVHEANPIPGRPTRYYKHRFVMFNMTGGVMALSLPFVFHDKQIEFAAGLAYFPKKRQLMVSYGVRDCEAWLGTMSLDDVVSFTCAR